MTGSDGKNGNNVSRVADPFGKLRAGLVGWMDEVDGADLMDWDQDFRI